MIFYVLRAVILILGPLVGYLVAGTRDAVMIGLGLSALVVAAEILIDRVPLDILVFGAIGAFAGLVLARVVTWLIYQLDNPTYYRFVLENGILINVLLSCLGAMVAIRKKSELDLLDKNLVMKSPASKDVKIFDTSSLIDGRIIDVIETGFLSGRFVVPRFVLRELQHVADSSDPTKRQRGRRGLDMLKRLQEAGKDVSIKVYDKDYPSIDDVDSKLVELGKELNAKVMTTDFNLSKVAMLQGVSVLNVNDLSAALKSVVVPGDNLALYLAKEGKEKSQAVGYLDDGTMVVVDDARKAIGRRVHVHVNSILQTPAGRMVFGRLQEGKDSPSDEKGSSSDENRPSPT